MTGKVKRISIPLSGSQKSRPIRSPVGGPARPAGFSAVDTNLHKLTISSMNWAHFTEVRKENSDKFWATITWHMVQLCR